MQTYKEQQELKLAKLKTALQLRTSGIGYEELSIFAQEILFLSELALKKRLNLWVSLGLIEFKSNTYKWVGDKNGV
jgi:hypothetical protein